MGVTISGLEEVRQDLKTATDTIVNQTRGVVARGSLNIKDDARDLIAGHVGRYGGVYITSYPRSIGYDVTIDGTVVSSEIGPDKSLPQGPLGNILEYGSINNGPIPHLNPALDREEQPFADNLEALGGDLLEGKGVRSDGSPDHG